MKTINWGILGTGKICANFANTIKPLPNTRITAVGSRSIDTAKQFADKYNIPEYYGSYEKLASNPDIDIIYIGTPNNLHCENTLLCLNNGKSVLCEKPFSVSAKEAVKMVNCARKNRLFLMEAMWTRFLPCITRVRQWIKDGRIGDIKYVSADFGFSAAWDPQSRVFNPALAGGALLDVGIYTMSFATMVLGYDLAGIQAVAKLGKTKVDELTAMQLKYKNGSIAQLLCAVTLATQHMAIIQGTKGSIQIPFFWRATSATLSVTGKKPVTVTGETGLQFEAVESMNCLRKGSRESKIMPLDETVKIMKIMDKIRKQINK